MDSLFQDLQAGLTDTPVWVQILWQAYSYTMLCWCIDSVEHQSFTPETLADSLEFVDAEFRKFPHEALFSPIHEHWTKTLMSLNPSKTQLEEEAEVWCEAIQKVVDPSIEIFSTLYDGQELTAEKWDALYSAMAFQPPQVKATHSHKNLHRTLRSKGRRAITPIRRRRGLTRNLKAR